MEREIISREEAYAKAPGQEGAMMAEQLEAAGAGMW